MTHKLKAIATLLVVACVPFIAAPLGTCPNCGSWEYALAEYEYVIHRSGVEDGENYTAKLSVSEGSATLAVVGDVADVSCSVDEGDTTCTFEGTSSGGIASLRIDAGGDGAETTLTLDVN